jgi:hypothetical protein
MVQTGVITSLDIKEYKGLSTETKPTLVANNSGSSYYCVDTGDYYIWYWNTTNSTGEWYLQ